MFRYTLFKTYNIATITRTRDINFSKTKIRFQNNLFRTTTNIFQDYYKNNNIFGNNNISRNSNHQNILNNNVLLPSLQLNKNFKRYYSISGDKNNGGNDSDDDGDDEGYIDFMKSGFPVIIIFLIIYGGALLSVGASAEDVFIVTTTMGLFSLLLGTAVYVIFTYPVPGLMILSVTGLLLCKE